MTANHTISVQGSRRCSISLYICHKDAFRCVKPWIPNTGYFVCTGSKPYICKHLALTSKTKRYYSDLGTWNTGPLSLITAKQYRKETQKKACPVADSTYLRSKHFDDQVGWCEENLGPYSGYESRGSVDCIPGPRIYTVRKEMLANSKDFPRTRRWISSGELTLMCICSRLHAGRRDWKAFRPNIDDFS